MSSEKGNSGKAVPPGEKNVHPAISAYLTLFNLLSAGGWAYVFYICVNVMIAAVGNGGYINSNDTAGNIWKQAEIPLKVVQTMALLEIIHSLLKFTRNSVFTVAMQVLSRIWTLWFSMDVAPDAQSSTWFILACVSWSLVEVPKYLFYVFKDIELLKAYRYNAFYVLYPTGISGEVGCMYKSFVYLRANQSLIVPLFKEIAPGVSIPAKILLYLTVMTFVVYLPGSPFMYINMMKMKKKAYEDEDARNEKEKKN